LLAIHSHDVVWINGPSLPITDTGCWFEKQVIQRGASYIFWLEDDYFSDPRLKDTAEARMELAHLIVAVTPNLRDRIAQLFKDRRLILLEEPIDVDRLSPRDASKERKHPLVLWSGRPWALKQLLFLDNVLEKVFRDFPFILRIVTGTKRPEISLSIPWEWMPYDRSREAEYACGAIAGLAPLENNVFNSCKGNYKVKTYMALGVPPLASAIGYNHQLIKHGETGFLARSNQEWEEALRLVLKDFGFAKRVGSAAREEMVNRYSYNALMPIWAETLKKAFPGKLGPIR
jgi:glycosyltransferase involved in cell wall biosynthesis